jgi:PhnB protein
MQLQPYLNFNGQCETALRFYEKTLGGKIEFMMNFGDSPMAQEVPAEWHTKIMHGTLVVDGSVLMASDAFPDRYEAPKGFAVSINLKSPPDAERIFTALADGGHVQMPIQQTFWAARFGMLIDRFGIPWMINCDQPA